LVGNISFFFQAEDGIRAFHVTGVQTCALPISEDFASDEVARSNLLTPLCHLCRVERIRLLRADLLHELTLTLDTHDTDMSRVDQLSFYITDQGVPSAVDLSAVVVANTQHRYRRSVFLLPAHDAGRAL